MTRKFLNRLSFIAALLFMMRCNQPQAPVTNAKGEVLYDVSSIKKSSLLLFEDKFWDLVESAGRSAKSEELQNP